jgi:hypothetical protein
MGPLTSGLSPSDTVQLPKIIMTGLKLIPLNFSFEINPWSQLQDLVISMNGKNCKKRQKEPMLLKKLKTQENEGATSKYPEHTYTKVFGYIPEVFVV